MILAPKGASINYLYKQGGRRGSPKCQRCYISLVFIKFVIEGGRGVKNLQNSVNVVYGCPQMGLNRNENEKCIQSYQVTTFVGVPFLSHLVLTWFDSFRFDSFFVRFLYTLDEILHNHSKLNASYEAVISNTYANSNFHRDCVHVTWNVQSVPQNVNPT